MPSLIRPSEGAEPFMDRAVRRLDDKSVRVGTGRGIALAVAVSAVIETFDFALHPAAAVSTPFALAVVLVAWLSTPAATIFAVVLASSLCGVQEFLVRGATVAPANVAVDAMLLVTLAALGALAYQLRRALAAVKRQAIRDSLTGLYNRRGFFELAAREITRSQRAGTPFTIVEMDLDGLKRINDVHGHDAGDVAIIRFAEHAAGRLRETDVLGRTGGDEFSLVLPLGAEAARAVIDKLIDIPPVEGQPELKVSAGAVSYPRASVSLHSALMAADREMYIAKALREGPSIVVIPD